ncbi:phytanoyl-CoA dioxygenase family protein [Sorangium sp. So ce296]|uniref:Phytanoyl-CoA dioxygenase n=1 Tax=Sorangium cellulosum TaxID=56 RepID=A0A150RU03_SORCE|nr:hypothetical protein BE18_45665 [Sorangium cellulosum]KYF89954.1 hypothetical protein BE20_19170 [Sorangium cellulosum]
MSSATLSDAMLRAFSDEGYLLVEGALPPPVVAAVIDELDAAVDACSRDLRDRGQLEDPLEEHGFDTRLHRLSLRTDAVVRTLFNRNYMRPALLELIRGPALLDLLEPLLGPEIACHPGYRVRPKLPSSSPISWMRAMPWHQDVAYLVPECDRYFYATVWIPLTESTEENGCIEVLPRGHRGILPHRNVHGEPFLEILGEALPPLESVKVPARPGDVLLMSGLMPHRSGLNRTERVRWSLDLRYHAADVPPGYSGEPALLVRSRSRPEGVIRDCADVERLREASPAVDAPRYRRWPTVHPT